MSHWEEGRAVVKHLGSTILGSSTIGCVNTQSLSFQTADMGMMILPVS